MRISLTTVLLSALSLTTASASAEPEQQTSFTLWIPSSALLPNPNALPPSTHATLSSLRQTYTAPLSTSNVFAFHNVTPGSYLADVHSGTHVFVPMRVDVYSPPQKPGSEEGKAAAEWKGLLVRAWETYRGNDWDNKGAELPRSGGELARFPVRVLGPKEYYIERGSFSVFGILKNPMILMGLVSMALFLGLPKLIDNMDPEMRAEFEEQQKKSPMGSLMGGGQQASANPMGNFDMAAYLAGQSNKKDEPEPSSSGNGKKGGKR